MDCLLASFFDELEKIAARVPFLHGTSGRWRRLIAGVGPTNAARDPNPRMVYTTISNRAMRERAEEFARDAVKKRGGSTVVAQGKMDTKKGWTPRTLTAWGRKHIGDVESAQSMVEDLDKLPKAQRGSIWEKLQRGVGSWFNPEHPQATLKPSKYREAKRIKPPTIQRPATAAPPG